MAKDDTQPTLFQIAVGIISFLTFLLVGLIAYIERGNRVSIERLYQRSGENSRAIRDLINDAKHQDRERDSHRATLADHEARIDKIERIIEREHGGRTKFK